MKILSRLRFLFRRKTMESEMAEEMRLHVELQAERHIEAGLSPVEARYAAQRDFGGVEQIKETARDQRGWRWVDDFVRDLSHGARLLRKNPGFTLAATTVLALGIGANVAVFNVVHSVLFAPATYARPDEIVRLQWQDPHNPQETREFSYPAYREIRAHGTFFSETAASALLIAGVEENRVTRRVAAAAVSANYFSVLGVMPAQGRSFDPEEETPGSAAPVVVVSHSFWRKHRFDPALLGKSVLINQRQFTVVGIMPEGFTGTTNLFFTELWLPLGAYDQVVADATAENVNRLSDAARSDLMLLARLKPSVPAAAAHAALETLAADLKKQRPTDERDVVLTMVQPSRFASPSNDVAVGWVGALLLGMAGIVLLVACLNLANMLLARGAARRKEIAVRLALGGARLRIVRQLLTEGFLLALLGGAGGLLLAMWSSDLLIASLSRLIPIELVWATRPDPVVLAATVGFSVFCTLVFALGPALRLSRGEVINHLKVHAGEDAVRRRWNFLPRNPLVSVQIALSLALLATAALFVRSAAGARAAETGLRTNNVFIVEADAGLGGRDQRQAQEVYRRLSDRLTTLPGVEYADVATDIPLSGLDPEKQVTRPEQPASVVSVKWNAVGAGYFDAAGLPLLRGRAFTVNEATRTDAPPAVIINETLAKRLWPDADPLGQRLQLIEGDPSPGAAGAARGTTFEVIGVVPSTRHTLFESNADAGAYLPFIRGFQSHVFFHVRFRQLSPEREKAAADLLRRTINDVDPTLPVLAVQSFAAHLDGNIEIWIVRTGAVLFAIFGGLALCLAVVGVYGVVAYSVARRTREIGIRMALGAEASGVQRMIVREGAVMLAGGLGVGLLLASGIGKLVSSLLYRVSALDPVAFLLAPLVLAVVTFLACWWPARRATKVSPMVALRTE